MTTTLQQDFLLAPDIPRSISLTKTTAAHADDILGNILRSSNGSTAVGTSYHINERGKVDFVCFSSCTEACLIKFSNKVQASKSGILALLLSGGMAIVQKAGTSSGSTSPKPMIPVAFNAARAALQISHVTGLPVKTVDLSSIFLRCKSPSDVAIKVFSEKANSWNITRLWLGDDKSAARDLPLQAWLAAWSVAPLSPEIF